MKWFTTSVTSTSTTQIHTFVPPMPNKQAVVRRLMNLPTAAGDTLKFYIPKIQFMTKVTRDTTPTQSTTHLYVDVDVAAGHVIGGYTLASTDWLIIATGVGYVCVDITTVTDVTGETYVDLTVPTLGAACVAGDKVYVVRNSYDLVSFSNGGTSFATYENFIAGNINCPMCIGSVSAGSNNCISTAVIEYV